MDEFSANISVFTKLKARIYGKFEID